MYIWLQLPANELNWRSNALEENKRNAAACMYQPQIQSMARFQSLKCKVLASLYIYLEVYTSTCTMMLQNVKELWPVLK
jgi:hypothetical protein